jgi:HEAT repeat protein
VPYDAKLAQRLLAMLRDKPMGHSFGPGTGLARMGPQGVSLLVALTSDGEMRERVAAWRGLAQASAEDLKPHLAHFALYIGDANETWNLRIAAIYALRALKGDCVECLPALREALTEEDYDLAKPCLMVLAEMGPRAAAAVPDLLPWLDEPYPKQADLIATTLGAIRSRPDLVLPALEGLITRQGSDAAAKAMGAFGPVAYDYAVRVLEDGDEYARYSVLWTFATLGEQAAAIVPRLVPLISGDDPDIALRVVGTLGFIGPKAQAAVPAIMERLAKGPDVLPYRAAADTLIRLGQPAEAALKTALRSGSEVERHQALRVLTRFHVRSAFALEEIAVLAQAKDPRVRGDAIEAAAVALFDPHRPDMKYPPTRDQATVARVRAILERGTKDKEEAVRARAAYYFGLLGSLDGRK